MNMKTAIISKTRRCILFRARLQMVSANGFDSCLKLAEAKLRLTPEDVEKVKGERAAQDAN